jgi:hypothetical protein
MSSHVEGAYFGGVVEEKGPFDPSHPFFVHNGLLREPDPTLSCGIVVDKMFKGVFAGYGDMHLRVTFKSLSGEEVQGKFQWWKIQSLVISHDWSSAFLDLQRKSPNRDCWSRRQSRRNPEIFYYWNEKTGETSVEPPIAPSPWVLCSYGTYLFRVSRETGEVKDGFMEVVDSVFEKRDLYYEEQEAARRVSGIYMQLFKKPNEEVTEENVLWLRNKILFNFESFHKMQKGSATLADVDRSSASLHGWASYVPIGRVAEGEDLRKRALFNFESFHEMQKGSAKLEDVVRSSASLHGWASYVPIESVKRRRVAEEIV